MPEFMEQGILMDNIVSTLNKYRAYSAVKDFLSLCVLYRYGGYYFDTTTVIVEKTPSNIVKLLTKYDELKIVRTKTGGLFRGLDMKSKTLDATLLANTNYSIGENLINTHGCDVWAMYAPPKHSAIRVMIESYIERAVELGLDEYPSKKKINGTNFDLIINMNPAWKRDRKKNITDKKESIHQILKEDWPGRDESGELAPKKWRNHIIGQLIICAVQEGIVKYFKEKNMWEEFDNTVTPEWMWQTDEPSDEEETKKIQGVLRDIGIGKIHAGQWRKV